MENRKYFLTTHWGIYQHDHATLSPFYKDIQPASFGTDYPQYRLAPCRILKPAIRKSYLEYGPEAKNGTRGQDEFIEVEMDFALDLAAKEIARIKQIYGNQAIYSGSYGWSSAGRFHHAQSQLKRFFNLAGGSVRSIQTYSYGAGETILPHIIGGLSGLVANHTSYDDILDEAELVLMFGGTPIRNAQVNSGGLFSHNTHSHLQKLCQKGIDLISISPVKSDSDIQSQWLSLRPNSDTALLLALCHHVLVNHRVDYNFINQYTTGFDHFVDYLHGKNDGIIKDHLWAAGITDINADIILSLGKQIIDKKTFIMVAWSLQRADHGEQVYWATIALSAMLGNIGKKGQGFGFGYSSAGNIGMTGPKVALPSLPQGVNPIKDAIPVARIADMLLNPNANYQFNGQIKNYPDIKLVYWLGGNPFHHHQDLNRLVEAWQRPQTIITHEHWWNAHARHADIVFPAATFLERDDIASASNDSFLTYAKALSQPPQGVTTDHEILKQLAQRLGFEEQFTAKRSEADWLTWLYQQSCQIFQHQHIDLLNYRTFQDIGYLELPKRQIRPLLSEFRQSPDENRLWTPSGRIEIYSKTIAAFNYQDCPPHPTWLPPSEWLGSDKTKSFPLHLLTCQPSDKLHSQWDHAAQPQATKQHGRQPILIHEDDAKQRNIKENDLVRVFNERGACLAIAKLSQDIKQGVTQMATGAWFNPWQDENGNKLELNGNPNVLTQDQGTSTLTQATSANSCLVEVEKYHGIAPKTNIYEPPQFG